MSVNNPSITVIVPCNLAIPLDVKDQIIQAINVHHTGQPVVNILDFPSGRIIPNPELTITENLKEAVWMVYAWHTVNIKVTVDLQTGNFSYAITDL